MQQQVMTREQVENAYEIKILQPAEVSFSRGKGGVFQGVINRKLYNELILYRAFPFLYTTQYISIQDAESNEIGIVKDIDELDAKSKREIETELAYRYFLPQVIRVDRVKQKTDLWIWELQTTLGPTRMTMPNLHEHMQLPGGNRIILNDLSGKRCEIRDWKALDHHSRKQLKDVI